jgi:uncharacterized membrane protein (DUF485 family)
MDFETFAIGTIVVSLILGAFFITMANKQQQQQSRIGNLMPA